MNGLIRKIRGGFGMALIWAVGWTLAAFGILYGLSFFMVGPRGEAFWDIVIPFSLGTGAAGFVGGTVFSVALSTFFKNRNLGQLKPGRIALLGTASALLIPGTLFGVSRLIGMTINLEIVAAVAATLAVSGAVTGGGMIKVAQLAGGGRQVESGEAAGSLEP